MIAKVVAEKHRTAVLFKHVVVEPFGVSPLQYLSKEWTERCHFHANRLHNPI